MSDSYDYYEERVAELTGLYQRAQSVTTRQLFLQAIDMSNKAANECLSVGRQVVERVKKLNEKESAFTEQISLLRKQSDAKHSVTENPELSIVARRKFEEGWNAVVNELEQKYTLHSSAIVAERAAVLQCQKELDKSLFEYIFKPDSSRFSADIVLDFLKKLVQKMVRYIDDLETIFNMNVTRQKNNYLNKGDKLLVYVENYIAVLETWLGFTNQFKTKVLV